MKPYLVSATVLSITLLVGCSAQPKVLYEVPPENKDQSYTGDWEGLPRFTLAKSQLVISLPDDEKNKAPAMVSVPAEVEKSDQLQSTDGVDVPTRFILRQKDSFGVDTHLKLTKLDNTDLIHSFGTEVEDKRVKYIQGAASVLVGVIGAFGLDGEDPERAQPVSIDTLKMLTENKIGRQATSTASYGKITGPGKTAPVSFKITFGAVKDDAINTDKFAAVASGKAQKTLIYSACRTATVIFTDGSFANKQFTATIADPRYVQTVEMPKKGSIDMHTACGANTTAEASSASSGFEVINAIIDQTKSVREAWKTAKSDAIEDGKAKNAHATKK